MLYSGTIQFDGSEHGEVRVIGKTNVVMTVVKDGKDICQVNIRKKKNKWIGYTKKVAEGYHGDKSWAPLHDHVVEKLELYLAGYYAEKILLS